MIEPICYDRHKIIDTLFRENVKEEHAVWDYFVIHDSEVIIYYHYWTYSDKGFPLYNKKSIKIPIVLNSQQYEYFVEEWNKLNEKMEK
jgi:hypothetical protein